MANVGNGSKARPIPEVRLGVEHRLKISKSNILNKMIKFGEAKPEDADKILSPSQVTCNIALMRKFLPDMSSIDTTVEHSGKSDLAELMEWVDQENNRLGPDYRPPEPVNGATPDGK